MNKARATRAKPQYFGIFRWEGIQPDAQTACMARRRPVQYPISARLMRRDGSCGLVDCGITVNRHFGRDTQIDQRIVGGRNACRTASRTAWLGGNRAAIGGLDALHDHTGQADQQEHRGQPEYPDLQPVHRLRPQITRSGRHMVQGWRRKAIGGRITRRPGKAGGTAAYSRQPFGCLSK